MTSLFLLVELLFKGIGLWDQFSVYITQKKLDQMSKEYEELVKAINAAKAAKTKSDAYEAQNRITFNSR